MSERVLSKITDRILHQCGLSTMSTFSTCPALHFRSGAGTRLPANLPTRHWNLDRALPPLGEYSSLSRRASGHNRQRHWCSRQAIATSSFTRHVSTSPHQPSRWGERRSKRWCAPRGIQAKQGNGTHLVEKGRRNSRRRHCTRVLLKLSRHTVT